MATKTTEIRVSEKELAEILSNHYGFDSTKCTVDVYKYEGDQRDPSYTEIIFKTTQTL